MIPQMEKAGYPRVFATNVTITASVQALLVPPSHNAVIYSLATGGTISIISLFMAGVVPGLLLGFALVMLCLVIAYRDGHPRGQTRAAARGGEDHHRRAVGPDHARHHPRRHPRAASSPRSRPARSPASGRSSSPCSSTATIAGATCRRWSTARVSTVAMVMTLIACASSVGYIMALTQMPAKITAFFLTDLQRQERHPVPDQHPAAGARLPGRHGAVDPDLHADPAAGDDELRRRSGAFRHDHDAQPRHRPVPSAGRRDPVRRLRGRQGHDRAGDAAASGRSTA